MKKLIVAGSMILTFVAGSAFAASCGSDQPQYNPHHNHQTGVTASDTKEETTAQQNQDVTIPEHNFSKDVNEQGS